MVHGENPKIEIDELKIIPVGNWCNWAKCRWTATSNSRTFDIAFLGSYYIRIFFLLKLVHISHVMLQYPDDNLVVIQLLAPTGG